jgi:hypothetical protein
MENSSAHKSQHKITIAKYAKKRDSGIFTCNQKKPRLQLLQEHDTLALEMTSQQNEYGAWRNA